MSPALRPSSSRTTVVHLITRLELGGAQENTLYTCKHLNRDSFDVVLMFGPGGLMDPDAHRIPNLRTLEVPELIREVHAQNDLQAILSLYRKLSKLRREHIASGGAPSQLIVHTHSSKAGILGRAAARAARVPHIVHSIHGFGFYEGQDPKAYQLFLAAERAAGRLTDAFISVSKVNLQEAHHKGIVPRRARSRVIRSGMNLDTFRNLPPRGEARRQLTCPYDAEIVLCIANFKAQKDPLTLLEAFRLLAERRPKSLLLFAGDGPLRPAAEAYIDNHSLSDRVRLLGWRRDVPRLLAATDIVALSSIFEGLPRSAVQALAARRPFVGTRVDGTPEVIRDGVNGFLVPPKNPRRLAEALEKGLVEQPVDPADEVHILAWDADQMVREQEFLYEELLNRPLTSARWWRE